MQRGIQKGRQEGERTILRRQIDKRFGELPAWFDQRLATLSQSELEDLSLRLFDANTIEELFTP